MNIIKEMLNTPDTPSGKKKLNKLITKLGLGKKQKGDILKNVVSGDIGGASKNPFTEYLYFKFANVTSEEFHTDVGDYLFNLRLLTFDKFSQTRVDLDNTTTIDILHCIYKIKDNNANGTAIYLNDLVQDIGSGFIPSWEYMEQGYAEISIAIPKYTMNLVFGSGGAYIGDSLNVFVDTLELLKSLIGADYKELLKYQITEEEFWKEATIANIDA